MTVTSTETYAGPYVPNGVTTVFPFGFAARNDTDLVVLIDGSIVSSSLYTVTLAADFNSGSVMFTTAPTGSELFILSEPAFDQQIQFTNQGAFLPNAHDIANDLAAIRSLYLKALLDRAPVIPIGQTQVPGRFPVVAPGGEGYLFSQGTGADLGLRQDLASAGGLTFVGETAPYTGAVSRPAIHKLHEYAASPLDWDANAGQNGDDTASVQAALTQAKSVFFPGGTYTAHSTLSVPGPVKIGGQGQGISTIKGAHNGSVLSWQDVWTNGTSIRDLTIDGNETAAGVFIGSDTEITAHMNWQNVQIANCTTGLWGGSKIFTMFDSVMVKVDFINCSIIGEVLSGSGNRHHGCTYRLCHYGIQVDQQASGFSIGGGSYTGGTWIGNTFDVVFNSNPCRQLLFDGCWFEQTVTSTFGNLTTDLYLHSLVVRGALFQPAATATGNGIWTPPVGTLGSVEFDSCIVFAVPFANANLPAALPTTSLLPQLSMKVTNSRRLLTGGSVEEIPSWDNASHIGFPKIMQNRAYANDAAAGAAGLTFGELYFRTSDGVLTLKN